MRISEFDSSLNSTKITVDLTTNLANDKDIKLLQNQVSNKQKILKDVEHHDQNKPKK